MTQTQRSSWDEYFMLMALHVATRATCNRAHVGAVIVKDKHVVATGYNGSPSGMPHCDDVGHVMEGGHCIATTHAELNALLQCAKIGISAKGSTMYVTHYPCHSCSKALVTAGVSKVIYLNDYRVHDRPSNPLDSIIVKNITIENA